MFWESNKFQFADTLESNWLLIRKELEQLQSDNFLPWPEKFLYEKGWEVFGLYAFGKKLHKNCKLCPETTKLVEMIPGMITSGFSSLAPQSHIKPHVGHANGVLRGHLGLIVPDQCAIRVGNETKSWQEGKFFIFDDTTEHEAWNYSETTRVILLIDILNPELKSREDSKFTCSFEVAKVLKKLEKLET